MLLFLPHFYIYLAKKTQPRGYCYWSILIGQDHHCCMLLQFIFTLWLSVSVLLLTYMIPKAEWAEPSRVDAECRHCQFWIVRIQNNLGYKPVHSALVMMSECEGRASDQSFFLLCSSVAFFSYCLVPALYFYYLFHLHLHSHYISSFHP